MGEPESPAGSAQSRPRHEFRHFVELLALCGLAIAQPVLSAIGSAPEHVTFRGVGRLEIVGFGIAVIAGPPLTLWVVGAAARRLRPSVGRVVHLATVVLLAAAAVVQFGWRVLELTGPALAVLALVAGVLFGLGFRRFEPLRVWTSFLSAIPVLALGSFLFVSPVSDLVLPADVETEAFEFESTPPIVILVLDELSTSSLMGADGRIDEQLFPNFADLADRSTWYRHASTVSNATIWAVPSILTGQLPVQDREPTFADHPENLFALLADRYEIRADESPLRLCPPGVCVELEDRGGGLRQLLRDALDVWKEQVSINGPTSGVFELVEDVGGGGPVAGSGAASSGGGGIWGFLDVERPQAEIQRLLRTSPTRFSDFVEAIEPSPSPTLDYLHILMPHTPWTFYPSGVRYEPHGGESDHGMEFGVWVDDAAATVGRQRYLLQTQYVDSLVGALLARLRAQNLFDETLLVVVADHGVSFDQGEALRSRGGVELPSSVVDGWWSPLFVKLPDQADGEVSDLPVETIDVLPTIVDVLGADPDWPFDGTSINELGPADEDRTICLYSLVNILQELWECEAREGPPLAEVVERSTGALLPPTGDRWRIYRAGPHGELVGQRLEEVTVDPTGESHEVVVAGLDAFSSVDPDTAKVPGHLLGQLVGGEAGVDVAIALNGTVVATTRTYATAAQPAVVHAILPDFAFRDGGNTLGMYQVLVEGDETVLSAMTISG